MLKIKLVTKFENEEKLMSVLKGFIKHKCRIIPIVTHIKDGQKNTYYFKITNDNKSNLRKILKNIDIGEYYISSIDL